MKRLTFFVRPVRLLSSGVACAILAGLSLTSTGCDALSKYRDKLAEKKATEAFADAREQEAAERAELEARDETPRAAGPGFSVPVPSGFSAVVDPAVKDRLGRGIALTALERTKPDWFLASIVFTPAGPALETKAKECTDAASVISAQGSTVTRAELVQIGGTERCQIEGTSRAEPNHGAVMTMMSTAKEAWGVTCNYDTRDDAARAACTTALEGWQVEA